jgi:Tfp pilus assembly protein PilF
MCRSLVQVPRDILADPAAALVVTFAAKDFRREWIKPLVELAKPKPSAKSLMQKAEDAVRANDLPAAKAAWLAAVEAAGPRDAEVFNNAAWFLCTTEEGLREPAKAEEIARRALAASDRSFIRDTLAEALLLNGKAAEAKRENDQVLLQEPDSESAKQRAERIAKALAK